MTETASLDYSNFLLPPNVVSRVDVSRLVMNAEKVDNTMATAAVHAKVGVNDNAAEVMSEQFGSFLDMNNIDFETNQQRSALIKQLRLLKDTVPVIHMTFAVEADKESLGLIVSWLRENIHKQAVVAVGLQPSLIAGVYLRTPNHVHDLSLKAKLAGSRDVLIKELEAARG